MLFSATVKVNPEYNKSAVPNKAKPNGGITSRPIGGQTAPI
jgi:hypothetical protein